MERAVRRAVDLIVTVAGGEPAAIAPLADAGVSAIPDIDVRPARVQQVLGVAFDHAALTGLLEPIGFGATPAGDVLRVTVPGHRRYDVAREYDVIEEIARRHGFDRFPDELRPFRPSVVPDDAIAALENRLREFFVGSGFMESRTASFTSQSAGDVALLLPLSAAESHLRRDLTHGLLRRVEANFNRGARSVRLFEIGTVFAPGQEGGIPREETHVVAAFTGPRAPEHWTGASASFDVWDLRGVLERLGEIIGIHLEPGVASAALDDAAAWRILENERALGWAGKVLPAAIDAPPWADPVFVLEAALTPAMVQPEPVSFRALPAFPAIERDLALVLPAGLVAADVERAIRTAAGPLLEDVGVFDVFADERFGAGRRSVAFRLRFRAPDRTLVDAAVDAATVHILQHLQDDHGVERRA
jgi:phenylalanyl-tRNA synthetase beta chain